MMLVKNVRTANLKVIGTFAAVALALSMFSIATYAAITNKNVTIEAEQGALSGQTAVVNSSLSSNGSFLSFTAAAAPPGTSLFSESFDTSDALNRFDFQIHTTNEPLSESFLGEHDTFTDGTHVCHGPTTYRTITPRVRIAENFLTVLPEDGYAWWCNPNGDIANGHMMTALDTGSIATLSFSPKQTFSNVHKVCYDQNMNNLGEGKWLNLFVVQASDVLSHGGNMNYAARSALPFGGVTQMLPPGAVDFTWLRGSTEFSRIDSNGNYIQTMDFWSSQDPPAGGPSTHGMDYSPASRYTICLNSGGDMVIERPDGTTDTRAIGATFPAGDVKVIFQDASYNPTKHNGSENHVTWHWDNIIVE